jgi:hypothetical protein
MTDATGLDIELNQVVRACLATGHVEGVVVEIRRLAALLRISSTNRTQWVFLADLQLPSTQPCIPSCDFRPQDLPFAYKIHPSEVSNENLLIFLHGLGDDHDSLFALGKAMELPQTGNMDDAPPDIDINSEQRSSPCVHPMPFHLTLVFRGIKPSMNAAAMSCLCRRATRVGT